MTKSLDHPLVAESDRTCFACPEQHEGTLVTGETFYFRYRYGHVTLSVDRAGKRRDVVMPLGDSLQGVFASSEERESVFADLLDGMIQSWAATS